MTLAKVELSSMWVKPDNEYDEAYELLLPEESGMGELTIPAPTVTILQGRDGDGNFVELMKTEDPPGDSPTFQVDFYGHSDLITALERYSRQHQEFYLQMRYYKNPPINIEALATRLEHFWCTPGPRARGAGRNLDASGGARTNNMQITAAGFVDVNTSTALSRITTASTLAGTSLLNIDRNIKDRTTGYRGPDKVMYLGLADSAAPAEIWVSINEGATWAVIATDPTPFAVNADILHMQYYFVAEDQFRLVVGRDTDAGTKAEWSYTDVTFGGEATVASWTTVTIAATVNGDLTEATLWEEANRYYYCSAGDIYLSLDLCETDPGSAIFTGANAFAAMFYDSERNVWAVGAANTILVELVNARGTFVARVGPSGGGAFTAIAVAKNQIMFAGNGQYIYRNTNEARTAGGWSQVKDLGAGYTVKSIYCVRDSSEIVVAFADDGALGVVWVTYNGGLTWVQKTATSNSGYNVAVKSLIDDNLFFLTGPTDTGTTLIEKLFA
jgi:hypothetical protein